MGHLKLKDGTTFPLNLSVGDIRDISKRSGAFSKTITLVGDDDNNNLLNHYYDVNVIAGTFDVNKLQQCQVIQNGIVILDNAYMQLVEVVKSQTTDAHNQQIEYKVLVKDSVSDFFTKLGNKTLTDINVQDIIIGTGALTYEASEVTASFNNTIADGYKFLMPLEVVESEFNTKAFHPAIYAKIYFDTIFQDAGFTYEWGNQSPGTHTTNDNYFEKLVIPYNGDTPKIDRSEYLVEATYATGTALPFGSGLTWTEQVTGFTEVTDGESIFDPTNGDYSVPFWIQNPENIEIQVTINFDVDVVAASAATRSGAGSLNIQLAGKEQAQSNYVPANIYTFIPASNYSSGTTSVVSGESVTVTFNPTNMDNTDILELFARSVNVGTFSYDVAVDVEVTVNSSSWKILPSSDTIGYLQDLNLNTYVPKQVKQADFIKSIFMMYNLYAEVDKSQPNKIILKHRDDYYDSGTERDWTEKLAKDRDQTIQFLPELSAKKMALSYKDDKDDINVTYKDITNETYGQIEYTFENEYVKGIDRKEIIFSPTPTVRSSFGAFCPALSYIPATNIRILVDGGTQTCDSFDIYNYYTGSTGVGELAQTTAPLLTHFDDPITPSFDLNFATCDYYFYSELSQKTNNNLYNLYWRRTLGQIDKGKMLTAYFDLLETDIQSLNLNDKIRIDNSWWHINRVIDYDANEHKLTKVELISVDEEIEFTPFATTPTVPVKPTTPVRPVRPVKPNKPGTYKPVQDIIRKNNYAKNLYSGDNIIMGRNNVIGSDVKNAIVIGDNNIVEEDKIIAPVIEATDRLIINGSDVEGNFATENLTLTGNRVHSTDGNTLVVSSDGATLNESKVAWSTTAISVAFGGGAVSKSSTYTSTKIEDSYDGDSRVLMNSTETVINEDGKDLDTRIEGDTDQNLVVVDASTDKVGVGTNTPSKKLDVNGDVNVASGSAYHHNGTAGLSGTYTFGGGGTGDIATMTFNGGILTAVTTVP